MISETNYSGAAVNEVGSNFELYCNNKITAAFPQKQIRTEQVFGTRKKPKRTPDIRVSEKAILELIIECKATLLLFEDKFEKVNVQSLPNKSDQIVKGFLQVWRYIRDSKQDLTPDKNISPQCKAIVLTLEEWIVMDKNRHDLFLKKAHELADAERIPVEARITTIVTSVKDYFHILERATFDEFLECIDSATNPEFNGFILQNVFKEIYGDGTFFRSLVDTKVLDEKIWYWSKTEN